MKCKEPGAQKRETYHEDRPFEHRASATELGKQSLLSELPACGTPQFARAANKSALPLGKANQSAPPFKKAEILTPPNPTTSIKTVNRQVT
jgi:hypothetical protein